LKILKLESCNKSAISRLKESPDVSTEYQIEREDWTLFANLETLSQKAGVPVANLRRLALKELADNAMDAAGWSQVSEPRPGVYRIEDDGPGIDGDPEQIARLFSINRPLVSVKLWRRPSRGALGNGLRVVAGALIASGGGFLTVWTRNQRLDITPLEDGGADVEATPVEFPVGTRIEISFGHYLPKDPAALFWAHHAIMLASGRFYSGKSSVHWYDAESFYTLIHGGGARLVREFISNFDGCSGAKAGEIAANFLNRTCASLSREEATELLITARSTTQEVTHRRLGAIGRIDELPSHYAHKEGSFQLGARTLKADLPFVVEAWADPADPDVGESDIRVSVNGTPITGEIEVYRNSKKELVIYGCNLHHEIEKVPKKGDWFICLNIIVPHMPITSDGKTPDLEHFCLEICEAIASAIRRAKSGATCDGKPTHKSIFLNHLDEAIATASGAGKYRFSLRQLFYALRPFIIAEHGREPKYGNFNSVITDFENRNGDIEGMYRDDRGVIYHPHMGEGDIPLGTLMVESYERPKWTFNKLITIEKQGFFHVLKDEKFPERHDCMLATAKGFSTRAIRDLIDKLAEHDEPVTVFCVHDADAAGTMIYQTMQEETRARGARKIKIIDLGMQPWEAEAMGLASEEVEETKKGRAVADYVKEYDAKNGTKWAKWLQDNRYELNAMTTPEFLEWLEAKVAEYDTEPKVIPPAYVVANESHQKLEQALREQITERILREAKLDEQVAKAIEDTPLDESEMDEGRIAEWLNENPEESWRSYIDMKIAGKTETE
jgi:hypothetical protein